MLGFMTKILHEILRFPYVLHILAHFKIFYLITTTIIIIIITIIIIIIIIIII